MSDAEYMAPKDLEELHRVMADCKGRAKFIAGGTNVIPNIRAKAISPEILMDLSNLKDLAFIREENGTISIGALTTMSEIASSDIIRSECPVLFSAANQLGNPLTRNRATIGGNLADASPAADTAPPLLTMDALIHTESGSGKAREIPIDQFFLGPTQTVLEENELMTKITFSKLEDPSRGHHIKLGLRNAMAISMVSIAVMLEMEGEVCQRARVALGAIAPKPIRAYSVEKRLEGNKIDEGLIEECSRVIKEDISPISDIRASAEYRIWTTSVLLKRAIEGALKGGEK